MSDVHTDPRARLEAFERMLSDAQRGYEDTVERMAQLRAEGREKTVTFRQLMAGKLTYQNLLSMYRSYGLISE